MTEVERHLAAEIRAKEEGHNVRWDDEARCFVVVSDTRPGVHYHLHVSAQVPASRRFIALVTVCDCPYGQRAGQMPAGRAGCKHQARVLQRLEREGLARWDRTQARFIAYGKLREAALADADARPVRDDPPTTLSGPGIPRQRDPQPDDATLARQIAAGM